MYNEAEILPDGIINAERSQVMRFVESRVEFYLVLLVVTTMRKRRQFWLSAIALFYRYSVDLFIYLVMVYVRIFPITGARIA
jgi:hypothetical protein